MCCRVRNDIDEPLMLPPSSCQKRRKKMTTRKSRIPSQMQINVSTGAANELEQLTRQGTRQRGMLEQLRNF